jgi:hypothetical protein
MSLRAFFEWMGQTPWSIAIHESLLLYPIIESVHVLFICLFFGMVLILDLRLLGFVLRGVPLTEVTNRILPWAFVGFVPMVISGVLLVYQDPMRAYNSVYFRAKVILLVLAGLNALAFHTGRHRARLAGAFSLILWSGVIITGRFIAYNLWQKGGAQ